MHWLLLLTKQQLQECGGRAAERGRVRSTCTCTLCALWCRGCMRSTCTVPYVECIHCTWCDWCQCSIEKRTVERERLADCSVDIYIKYYWLCTWHDFFRIPISLRMDVLDQSIICSNLQSRVLLATVVMFLWVMCLLRRRLLFKVSKLNNHWCTSLMCQGTQCRSQVCTIWHSWVWSSDTYTYNVHIPAVLFYNFAMLYPKGIVSTHKLTIMQ